MEKSAEHHVPAFNELCIPCFNIGRCHLQKLKMQIYFIIYGDEDFSKKKNWYFYSDLFHMIQPLSTYAYRKLGIRNEGK